MRSFVFFPGEPSSGRRWVKALNRSTLKANLFPTPKKLESSLEVIRRYSFTTEVMFHLPVSVHLLHKHLSCTISVLLYLPGKSFNIFRLCSIENIFIFWILSWLYFVMEFLKDHIYLCLLCGSWAGLWKLHGFIEN